MTDPSAMPAARLWSRVPTTASVASSAPDLLLQTVEWMALEEPRLDAVEVAGERLRLVRRPARLVCELLGDLRHAEPLADGARDVVDRDEHELSVRGDDAARDRGGVGGRFGAVDSAENPLEDIRPRLHAASVPQASPHANRRRPRERVRARTDAHRPHARDPGRDFPRRLHMTAAADDAQVSRSGWDAGRVLMVVFGAIVTLIGAAILAGGGAIVLARSDAARLVRLPQHADRALRHAFLRARLGPLRGRPRQRRLDRA